MSLINTREKIDCVFKIDGQVAYLEYTSNKDYQKRIRLILPKELRKKDQNISDALTYSFTQKEGKSFIVDIGELEEILIFNLVKDIKESNLPKEIKQNIQGI